MNDRKCDIVISSVEILTRFCSIVIDISHVTCECVEFYEAPVGLSASVDEV